MSRLRIAAVLRSGGEYRPEHVDRLALQLQRHAAGVEFVCLSDTPLDHPVIPLRHGWPGWWSKLELFRPDLDGDLFFVDLDTTVRAPIGAMLAELQARGRPAMLEDFYVPSRPASGLMFLPEACRAGVWRRWSRDPDQLMTRAGPLGDQAVIGRFLPGVDRLQTLFPDAIVSFKRDVRPASSRRERGDGTIPAGAAIVCFHGKPRPWELPDWR